MSCLKKNQLFRTQKETKFEQRCALGTCGDEKCSHHAHAPLQNL